jgi:hypothetical protein
MGQIPPFMQGEGQQAPEPAKKNNTVLWVVLAVVLGGGCFVCVILAAILFPVFSQARKAAMTTQSLSNIKQIATGLMIYSGDYDDRLPKADQWQDLLYPYTKNADLFVPPYKDQPGGYALNSVLSQVYLYNIPDPFRTPMVFESAEAGSNLSGGIDDLRKAEAKAAIGMADSSARRVDILNASSFDWNPKLTK